jgi:hypothetical protein
VSITSSSDVTIAAPKVDILAAINSNNQTETLNPASPV